jgi:hypothetical protein
MSQVLFSGKYHPGSPYIGQKAWNSMGSSRIEAANTGKLSGFKVGRRLGHEVIVLNGANGV